jgi:Carboxypeptidase regulatory-like domain/TonB dependent receptor
MWVPVRFLIVIVLLLAPAAASAQRATTGTVNGKVVDSSGAVLPGATITLQSPEALGQFSAVSDANGFFRIANLPPATYEMKAELSGFQSVIRNETVRLNGVLDVEFTLSVGSVAETVTVIGQSPIVDPERAGLSVNISNKALTSVPVTTNRRFQDAWLVVPGVAINPATLELTGSERRTSMDGADVTDPYGGDIFSVNLNYDAVQEVEIKALGAEAADGSSMVGQFMNIVTKSGGNDFHGSAAFFVIPQSFNTSNVSGIAANQRKDFQPDTTLGGPILRNRVWFFGSYRRVQRDQTFNNAPVPVQNRGNLWFMKVTTQLNNNQRLQVSVQYDKVIQENAVIRGSVAPGRSIGSTTTGLSSATMQIANPSAFGTLIKGGPLASFNYNWVMSSNRVFQFVGSIMFNKPNDYVPNGSTGLLPTKIIQSNPTGNILGSLTTIAQEGGFGATDTSHRSMTYLSPSMTIVANRFGAHEFRGGADLYPNISNEMSTTAAPVEFYYRPPGTTGSQDVVFERDVLRSIDGTSSAIVNKAYEHAYDAYFQDRWKPSSRISIKAGVRVENNRIFTQDRQKVLGSLLATGVPTNTSDEEFHQWVTMPNFGIAYNAESWGVFRATANRGYEWLDLGGGDGTSHAPYVLATDVFRANPRTSGSLNQSLPGGFPLGLNFGGTPDDSIHNGRTYVNEFSGSWEHRLPHSSSFNTTFALRRSWDYQSGDDLNVVRNATTGALIGRPFPQYDTIRNTYNPNYTWQEQRSLQFLYTRNFVGGWGMNANYSYIFASRFRTRWNATSDTLQFYGISPEDATSELTAPRHHGRVSTFVKLPFDTTFSAFYIYTGANRSDVLTGNFALNATAPTVTLSNGRVVSDPFFNVAFPRALKYDADMLTADDSHLVNIRLSKDLTLAGGRKLSLSGDVFNLFNVGAATGFLSADARSSNFGVRTNYVPARVGQLGLRLAF